MLSAMHFLSYLHYCCDKACNHSQDRSGHGFGVNIDEFQGLPLALLDLLTLHFAHDEFGC